MEVMRNQEFLLLPPDDVSELLSSDDLNVPTEETIYHALVIWIKHDNASRKQHLAKLLAHIKLPLMAPQVRLIPLSVCIKVANVESHGIASPSCPALFSPQHLADPLTTVQLNS